MKLTPNFTLEELTVTGRALPNIPNAQQIKNLTTLAIRVLQPLRNMYGKPIKVNSAFRSTAVNTAVGGAATSQHCSGEAADLGVADNAELFQMIRDHFTFDQLIWEGGNNFQPAWVHVSYREGRNRKEVLRMETIGGQKKYVHI